ncbi:MAG TPA: PepSY domain-containing protein [Pseudomonadaceae bacterium]|nr:PepSY domain-containing protein [Pseudomonadaceae bacterium]
MKQLLSPGFVKSSLSSHSWLGLLVCVLMYLTCLSGTVAVLYTDFERWEQPQIAESLDYDPVVLEQAYINLQERVAGIGDPETQHVYINMPTPELPRTTIATDTRGWYINEDGSLGEPVRHDWTHFLTDLHNTLTLPASVGYKLVSLLGALLCGLIISGFMAHPSIFREAFSLRRQGSTRLEEVDLHNRLSVWGAPFHLMIAITGAFFGLTVLFRAVAGVAFFEGDGLDASAAIYGGDPVLQQEIRPPAVAQAIDTVLERFPDTPAVYITLEHVHEPDEQYMLVGTRHYDRLIWVEQHRFDAAGNYLDNVGYSDGEPGRQIVFSFYRLHFGNFAGWLTKGVYILLGLALTVVAASGVNIWLARRKTRDVLNNVWVGVVWGAPMALALAALAATLLGGAAVTAVFWCAFVAAPLLTQRLDQERRAKRCLQAATGVLLLLLLGTQILRFGAAAFGPAALVINLVLAVCGLLFLVLARRNLVAVPKS